MSSKIKKIDLSYLSEYLVIISTITIFFVFGFFNKNFIGLKNIQNILESAASLLLMAAGVTFVILCGSIDLSTGSICTCAGVITGCFIADIGNWIIPLMIILGAIAGWVNGILITKLKMPSFIVTLCTMSIWKCVALVISGGASKNIPMDKTFIVDWAKIKIIGLPILFILALVIFLIFLFFERCTVIGKSWFAIGGNERAARIMGVNIDKAKIYAFIFCGIGSSLSGALYAVRLRSSIPTIGDNMTLLAIAAVVLGGTQLTGGKGSVLRTLLGAFTVIIIQTGLMVTGVGGYWQDIVFGTILIATIYLNSDKTGRDIIVK